MIVNHQFSVNGQVWIMLPTGKVFQSRGVVLLARELCLQRPLQLWASWGKQVESFQKGNATSRVTKAWFFWTALHGALLLMFYSPRIVLHFNIHKKQIHPIVGSFEVLPLLLDKNFETRPTIKERGIYTILHRRRNGGLHCAAVSPVFLSRQLSGN